MPLSPTRLVLRLLLALALLAGLLPPTAALGAPARLPIVQPTPPTPAPGFDVLIVQWRCDLSVAHHSLTASCRFLALGLKTAMTDPDMGTWQYGYDAAGRLVTQTDAISQVLWFGYDPLGRMTQKRQTGSTGALLAEYGYDQGDLGVGRRTAMTDTTGFSWWVYDARGQVLTETRSITVTTGVTTPTPASFTTLYAYDAAGRVITTTYPDGEVLTQTYNARGLEFSVGGSTSHGHHLQRPGPAGHPHLRQRHHHGLHLPRPEPAAGRHRLGRRADPDLCLRPRGQHHDHHRHQQRRPGAQLHLRPAGPADARLHHRRGGRAVRRELHLRRHRQHDQQGRRRATPTATPPTSTP